MTFRLELYQGASTALVGVVKIIRSSGSSFTSHHSSRLVCLWR
jgi:hypothetical protein